uniref:Uncharacterized protein n=1 Tax=Oryza rufipogon TaxID=4529 RepID=A0A0E0QYI5_ORYRU
MKGCSESDESPPVGPSPPPPALMPPAAPAPPPPTPCNCPMVPSPASHFRWVTKLRDGFIMAACTIGGWLFLIGLVRVCTMIRPHLPSWFPDMLHPSLTREILRLADWAKEHSAEDSTPALIIQAYAL